MRSVEREIGTGAEPFTIAVRASVVEIACSRGEGGRGSSSAWRRAQCLSRLLRRAIAEGPRTVIVNLEGSPDASTALLAVLVEATGLARSAGAKLVMRGSPALNRMAEICRLEQVLCRAESRSRPFAPPGLERL